MTFWLYNAFLVPLLYIGFHIAGLFNDKIRQGIRGRRHIWDELKKLRDVRSGTDLCVWIHVSSMGEFEQGLPVAKEMLRRYPKVMIVFSFFSPSGFEHAFVEPPFYKCYLPFDSKQNANRFVSMIQPDAALIIRHDIWPNHLRELLKRGIPSFLLDASISDERRRQTQRLAFAMQPVYQLFTEVCTVNREQISRFADIYPGIKALQSCGDTRYDRVLQRARETSKIDPIQSLLSFPRKSTLVAGSTWPSDESIILKPIIETCQQNNQFRCVLAPHEISELHINDLLQTFSEHQIKAVRLAELEHADADMQILVIDRIGLLANLYALGQTAFVGGAFGPGIHNVLEPAAHASYVLFGPRYTNSPEPEFLIRFGGGCVIRNSDDMKQALLSMLDNHRTVYQAGQKARAFVQSEAGAARKTVDRIDKYLQHK